MENILWLNDFGIEPDSGRDAQPAVCRLLSVLAETAGTTNVIKFKPGRYDFYPEHAFSRKIGISNHLPDPVTRVAFVLENCRNLVIDGMGAELVFHFRCLPFLFCDTEHCRLCNLTIDYEYPCVLQLAISSVAPDGKSLIGEIESVAAARPVNIAAVLPEQPAGDPFRSFITFEADGRLAPRIGDRNLPPDCIEELGNGRLRLNLSAAEFHPGQRLVLRPHSRPHPAILLYRAADTVIEKVNIHFAPGIGVLAQRSTDITLNDLQIGRRGPDDPRLFSLHADALHFSGCRGTVRVENSTLESMADDGINVHGIYLGASAALAPQRLRCRFMHPAGRGFIWGQAGDEIRLLDAETMEYLPGIFTLAGIRALDGDADGENAGEFLLDFTAPLPSLPARCGLENLTWTPKVIFRRNTIRNNRARGALFSTPQPVLCEDNVFDHVHGAAILLCGDCNNWYESGACRDVTIRHNRFINPLTALYEFCDAVISLHPFIPHPKNSRQYFHSGVRIVDNDFDFFDEPLLFAQSAENIEFSGNRIHRNHDFPAYHPNRTAFRFEHCRQIVLDTANFGREFNASNDLAITGMPADTVHLVACH